ncbi:MAG TPA: hypothetical protein DCE56_31235 [Cyanobacteria bacterium UBA8553]|nr:hypothetical protein [Cyanobacteria bacterium UBA8553]HAJ60634.1 hypothetical protein [Cyanobacteria bacterium UBA8543]
MTNFPNRQQLQVNGNRLAEKLNAAKLFNNNAHGFWEEILDKPVSSRLNTELSDREKAAELNGSLRQVEPLAQIRVSDRAPEAGSTNSTKQLDLFQVSLELLQERLA